MNESIRRLSAAFQAAFLIVAMFAGYWALWRAPGLLAREDNPRQVLAEQSIQRGQIFDRDGVVLADTTFDDGIAVRDYPTHGTAPVVGYYSLRYGTSGIENEFNDLLRGDTADTYWQRRWADLLHHNPVGGDVRLTLDAAIQEAATNLLAGRKGSIVVLAVPSGEVLAMASAPSYDPNTLDENWEVLRDDPRAPLLNRATQGLYQPGAILESIVLGAGLNAGTISLDDPAPGSRVVTSEGVVLPCAADSQAPLTMADAFVLACPAPFEALGTALGFDDLKAALSDFGLLESPAFVLPIESSGSTVVDLKPAAGQMAIGQSDLTVTPLHMARVAAAFANHGQMPPLKLVSNTRLPGGVWQPFQVAGTPRGTISRANADAIAALMVEAVRNGAAQRAALSARSVAGHAGLALTGPDEILSAWFMGFIPVNGDEALSVAVLLEDTPDAGEAAALGGQILQTAINAR